MSLSIPEIEQKARMLDTSKYSEDELTAYLQKKGASRFYAWIVAHSIKKQTTNED
jgi:hypothetical protein